VRAQGHELAGAPLPSPGLGGRFDYPLDPHLLFGVDLGLLFDATNNLEAGSLPEYAEPAETSGGIVDLALALRPMWRVDRGRIELYLSVGAGVSVRTAFSGTFPVTDHSGATSTRGVPETSFWGVLAQAGIGSTFWLSPGVGVFVEMLALARQTNGLVEDHGNGDFLMQINEASVLLLMGVGTALGDP